MRRHENIQKIMKYRLLWLLILLLFAGDIATTIYGLEHDYEEGNDFVVENMDKHGEVIAMLLLLPVKLGAMVIAMAGQWAAGKLDRDDLRIVFPLIVLVVLALPPFLWNLWVLA